MCLFLEATTSDGYPVPRGARVLCNGLIRSFAEPCQEKANTFPFISYVRMDVDKESKSFSRAMKSQGCGGRASET